MQSQGYPVTQDMILLKGNEIYLGLYRPNQLAGYLRRGWLNQFMNRHPLLTTRTYQVIKRVRTDATEEGLQIFIWDFMKHVTKQKITDDCIFNMDEMGFAQKNKTRRVISVIESIKCLFGKCGNVIS